MMRLVRLVALDLGVEDLRFTRSDLAALGVLSLGILAVWLWMGAAA